jgi:hypothetical protein
MSGTSFLVRDTGNALETDSDSPKSPAISDLPDNERM